MYTDMISTQNQNSESEADGSQSPRPKFSRKWHKVETAGSIIYIPSRPDDPVKRVSRHVKKIGDQVATVLDRLQDGGQSLEQLAICLDLPVQFVGATCPTYLLSY